MEYPDTMASSNPLEGHSPILSAVVAWYNAVTNWDLDALADLFDDSYRHTTLPAIADDGVKNKEQGLAYTRSVSEALGKLPMKVTLRGALHWYFEPRSSCCSTKYSIISRAATVSGLMYGSNEELD